MYIVNQVIYDIKLDKEDELGDELYDIMLEEARASKYKVVLHQVIKVDRYIYTVIVNHYKLN